MRLKKFVLNIIFISLILISLVFYGKDIGGIYIGDIAIIGFSIYFIVKAALDNRASKR